MKTLKKMKCVCPNCMEEHSVSIVEVNEKNIFKGEQVNYFAQYYYCNNAEEFFEDEEQISKNDIAMKDAYRKLMGLLTSNDIIQIRQKYGISQSDLALILGWGEKTITRYEGHQVQDVAHDSILRKIDCDPDWYLELLDTYCEKHTLSSYQRYQETALKIFEKLKDEYLQKTIKGIYAKYKKLDKNNGFTELDLQKVVDVVRYFSNSPNVKYLYKVKLMKMLWYADALSYKKSDKTITGLVYEALPMGAVPIAYDLIIDLNGISYEVVDFDDEKGCHFLSDGKNKYSSLSKKEIAVLDQVIKSFGNSSKKEIVDSMHREEAYRKTKAFDVISFTLTKELSI